MPRMRIELGVTSDRMAASQLGRRQVLGAVFGILTIGMADAGEQRRFRIAFANLNDDPSARVEGLGFSAQRRGGLRARLAHPSGGHDLL